MAKTRLRSNSDAITKSLMQKNLTAKDAAQVAGLNKFTLSRFLNNDAPISYRTAQKLIKFFGNDSVTIAESF